MRIRGRKGVDLVLALDFGGTKLLAGIVDPADGAILARCQRQTPAQMGADASIKAMLNCARSVLGDPRIERNRVDGIGISFGGPVREDRRAVLKSMHVVGWEDLTLPDRLSSVFGLPAVMDNDANTAALAEVRHGVAKHVNNLIYVQLSTGVGSGIVADHRVYRGNGQAGELGHITVAPGGPRCVCGKCGCLESILSGWAIAREGREELVIASPSSPLRILCGNSGDRLDAKTVVQASRQGDERALRVIARALDALASAIGTTICLLDPQLVIIGGGLGKGLEAFADDLRAQVNTHLPRGMPHSTRIEFSALGDNAALIGAACLLEEEASSVGDRIRKGDCRDLHPFE